VIAVPYEIVYDQATGEILAARPSAAPAEHLVLGQGQARLFADIELAGRPIAAFRVQPATNQIAFREGWTQPEAGAMLEVQSDVQTVSPIDGALEIPADGTSAATFTVQKRSLASGRALTGSQHDNLVTIRTTAGTLSARQLRLQSGKATFTLRSSLETVVAEVRVTAERIPGQSTLRIEFAPTS
jgi:hypothetical protein